MLEYMVKAKWLAPIFVFLILLGFVFAYALKCTPGYLSFSDSVKVSEAAKSLIKGEGMRIRHSFFDQSLLHGFSPGMNFPLNILPLPIILTASFFKFLPQTDQTVTWIGMSLFVLIGIVVFILGKKLHSTAAGIIAAILFAGNLYFLDYAVNNSSELLFSLEILLFVYSLIVLKSKILAFVMLIPMFITREQSLLMFFAYFIYVVIDLFKKNIFTKALLGKLLILFTILTCVIYLAFKTQNVKFSPLKAIGSINISSKLPSGVYLRGFSYEIQTPQNLASKTFYNLYNFAKAPERLVSPVVLVFFILSLFFQSRFRLLVFIIFTFFVLATSITLPNARYVHPTIPIVIVSASIGMMKLLELLHSKNKTALIALVMTFFAIFPTIGKFTVDTRFMSKMLNLDKPPVYKVISEIMGDNIPKGHLIVTNLDAWAAWYRGLTTMWFPLKPSMLDINFDVSKGNTIEYIVITNYKENDADFALGEWKKVLDNPEKLEDPFLKKNYKLMKKFEISPDQVYEKQKYYGVILEKL